MRRFYGEIPKQTVRAIVVLLNDEPTGIIGLAMGADCATMYSEYKPELEPHLKRMTVLMAIRAAMKMMMRCKRPVYAVQHPGTNILTKLGFEHLKDDIFVWPG